MLFENQSSSQREYQRHMMLSVIHPGEAFYRIMDNFVCQYLMAEQQLEFIVIMLLELFLGILIVLGIAVTYKYYLKPKSQLKRYVSLFRNLGYTVYEYPFSFLGLPFKDAQDRGVALHRDAQYLQKTVFTQVDVAICNCVEQVLIFIINPDLMKEFFNGHTPYNYPKPEYMVAGLKAVLGESGLSFSEGEMWKKKRKVMSRIFNFDLITLNIPKMVETCNRCFERYEKTDMIDERRLKVDNYKMASGIFNGIMMKCFFGNDYIDDTVGGKIYPEFITETIAEASDLTLDPLIASLGKLAWKLGITAKVRQVNRKIALMREKAEKILKERTEEVMKAPRKEKCTDIIEALIYEKLDKNEQFVYSDTQIIDEYQSFMVAGTDTATRFFSMILFSLGNHPEIHKRVRDDINAIIKSDEDITLENLKKLTYIDWIQQETTRMYGPVNGILFRNASEDLYIKEALITKDTLVSTQPLGNHYNPKYFKDPWVFRPERWESECDGLPPFAYVGFGGGVRPCIGRHLAYTESKVALIKVIKRYEKIEVPEKLTMHVKFMHEPEPFDITFTKIATQ